MPGYEGISAGGTRVLVTGYEARRGVMVCISAGGMFR